MPRLRYRVEAGGDRLATLTHDRVSQDDRGGRAVAGDVVGLAGDFAHHLGAHVLELVGQFDFLRDGDTILGDPRRAVALVQDHVAALGAKGDPHGLGQGIDATQHPLSGIRAEAYVFGCHLLILMIE